VPWEYYEELRKPLRRIVPAELPLPPGTDFGPLVGSITGPATDFAWVWDWDCLVRKDALARLEDHLSAEIQTARSEITSRRKEKPVYAELVALPSALLTKSSESGLPHFHCDVCGQYFCSDGYMAYAEPPGITVLVERSSIPQKAHVFRIRQLSRWVVCTDLFRQAVTRLGLRNIRFEPVEVGDE
jgi:hypothetical protein